MGAIPLASVGIQPGVQLIFTKSLSFKALHSRGTSLLAITPELSPGLVCFSLYDSFQSLRVFPSCAFLSLALFSVLSILSAVFFSNYL